MAGIIDQIAPFVSQREALAEACLLRALQTEAQLAAFQKLARLDGRARLIEARSQQTSDDRQSRHDIVLIATQRSFRVELKGDAPYTRRQVEALKRGSEASEQIRIDVLVLPRWQDVPEWIHQDVKIVRWEDIDEQIVSKQRGLGRISDLWLGTSRPKWRRLIADARAYSSYRRGERETARWASLWQSMDYVKAALDGHVRLGRIGGTRNGDSAWCYGMSIRRSSRECAWLGWGFSGGQRGPFKIALFLSDPKGVCWPRFRSDLPEWLGEGEGILLADFNEAEDIDSGVDLDAVCRRLRQCFR